MAGQHLTMQRITRTEPGYSARFELFIDAWARPTTLFVGAGIESRSLTLEIGPHTRKLDQNAFDEMLSELAGRSQGLPWGLAPGADRGTLTDNGRAAVHPTVIESQLPILERLLACLAADPPMLTVRSREYKPIDFSRRVDLQTLRWLSQRPQIRAAILEDQDGGQVVNPRIRIDQPTHYFLDHPVTRYVAFLLRRVHARFSRRLHATARSRQ